MAAGVPPRLKVIAEPDAIEAARFGVDGELDEIARAKLLGRRLVAQLERSHMSIVSERRTKNEERRTEEHIFAITGNGAAVEVDGQPAAVEAEVALRRFRAAVAPQLRPYSSGEF